MNRRIAGIALVLGVASGFAVACSASGSSSDTAAAPYEAQDADSGGEAPAIGQGETGGQGTSGNKEGTSGGAGDKNVSQPGVDRALVRTANMELSAADVGAVVDKARDVAVLEGGYAGREEVREEAATLTLYIPSDRFDQALDELSGLGKVISRNQTAEDVTEQVVDLDSRIATQRASVDRVRALLARANTVDEIVRIEQELTTREAALESLLQRREALGGQVAMSTVTISVSKNATAPAPQQQEEESSGFLAGLSDGWGAFLDAGGVTLQVLGAVLPFVLVLAIPGVLALRWRRRRRTTEPAVQQP